MLEAFPPQGRDDLQIQIETPLGPEEECELSHGERVTNGNGPAPQELRTVGGFLSGALYGTGVTADGIGAVQHPEGDACIGARIHDVGEGPEVGEKTGAHILEIEDHELKIGQHGSFGPESGSVEADQGEPGARVRTVENG
jgi:hypothetical protein